MTETIFDCNAAGLLARTLIRTARDAALGTLDATGHPNASHVAVATLVDGAPLLLVSDLAVHTRNLKRDARASLLFVAETGAGRDTNTRARVTLVGDTKPVDDRAAARDRFLRRHPDAELYIDFADFSLLRFAPRSAHLVAGFGRIVDLEPRDILADAELARALAATDADGCAHMNEDHADALALMAQGLAGEPAGDWRAIGLDPQGIDLAAGGRIARVEYDAPVGDGGRLRVALKRLADRAREAQSGQT